jgi:hypothetical protein
VDIYTGACSTISNGPRDTIRTSALSPLIEARLLAPRSLLLTGLVKSRPKMDSIGTPNGRHLPNNGRRLRITHQPTHRVDNSNGRRFNHPATVETLVGAFVRWALTVAASLRAGTRSLRHLRRSSVPEADHRLGLCRGRRGQRCRVDRARCTRFINDHEDTETCRRRERFGAYRVKPAPTQSSRTEEMVS